MTKPFICILALLYGFILTNTGVSSRRLSTRDEKLDIIPGAILLKDGEQTSCELGVMSNRYAFVGASCFTLDDNLNAVNVSQYEVLIDNSGVKDPTPGRFKVSNVVVNPGYNPKSLVNNLAIVKYNSQSEKRWRYAASRTPAASASHLFVRRSISDVVSQRWNTMATNKDVQQYDGCRAASPVYAANAGDFWCTTVTTKSVKDSLCNIPFSLGYWDNAEYNWVAAVYSHSVTYDDKACGSTKQYHYYTLLYNYLIWISQQMPVEDFAWAGFGADIHSNSSEFSMKPASSPNADGTRMFKGDMFARDAPNNLWIANAEESSTGSSATTGTAATATDTTGTTGTTGTSATSHPTSSATDPVPEASPSAHTDSSSDSLSKKQIIAIAVAVPIATLLIATFMFFAYKRWVKHKNTLAWDPSHENNRLRVVALEIGDAGTNAEAPPQYDAQNFSIQNSDIINSK